MNRWRASKKAKRLLGMAAEGYAEWVGAMEQRVSGLSDADLSELAAGCRAVSRTNCGWDEYAAASTILRWVDAERYQRRRHRVVESVRSGNGDT